MNRVQNKDLWQEEIGRADVILVTTNADVNSQGKLVMGAGAAKQAAMLYPRLPGILGKHLIGFSLVNHAYGLIVPAPHNQQIVGAFQVKYSWKDPADIGLISHSTEMLFRLALQLPDWRFAMNYPGIGNGGLDE